MLPTLCSSQNDFNCSLIKTVIDSKKGDTSFVSLKPIIISDKAPGAIGLNFNLSSDGTFTLAFVLADVCLVEGSEIYVLFNNNQSGIVLKNQNSTNCEGTAFVFFNGLFGDEDKLSQLSSNTIKAFRVNTKKGYLQKIITTSQQKLIFDTFKCLQSKMN